MKSGCEKSKSRGPVLILLLSFFSRYRFVPDRLADSAKPVTDELQGSAAAGSQGAGCFFVSLDQNEQTFDLDRFAGNWSFVFWIYLLSRISVPLP